MPISTFYGKRMMDHLFINDPIPSPTTVHVGLCRSVGGLDDGSPTNEVSTLNTGYSRPLAQLGAADNQLKSVSGGPIIFPVAEVDWGTVTHIALLDADIHGNVIAWVELSADKIREIKKSDQYIIPAGALTVQMLTECVVE